MIALLSALLGFLASALPEVFKLLKGAQDNKHELAVMDKQIEAQRLAGTQKLDEIGMQADMTEAYRLSQPLPHSTIRWVAALSDSVRPILTYLFFGSYLAVKMAQFYLMTTGQALPWLGNISTAQAIVSLWGDEDMALFCAVITYWFGNRSLRVFRGRTA